MLREKSVSSPRKGGQPLDLEHAQSTVCLSAWAFYGSSREHTPGSKGNKSLALGILGRLFSICNISEMMDSVMIAYVGVRVGMGWGWGGDG